MGGKGIIKRYEIGDKIYEQKQLNLFQTRMILSLIGVESLLSLSDGDFVVKFADQLPKILAIVLSEVGKPLEQRLKDIDQVALDLSLILSLEDTMNVIADFFDINDFAAIMEKATDIMNTARRKALN